MTIYVVQGSTGEYSDHIEWLVKAYADEKQAQTHVVLAQARANELYAGVPRYYDIKGKNEHDPEMQTDYTGTHYALLEVEYQP